MRDIGIDEDGTFNTLVHLFDQSRNGNLLTFDPDADNLDEVAELFAGTELLAAISAGTITVLEPTAEQLDAIRENLREEGGLTRDGFATGTLPKALENPQSLDQIILSLGGTASDGTAIPSSLHIGNLDKLTVFQDALRQAGIDDDATLSTLNHLFDQSRNGNLRDFDPGAAADIASLFRKTDLLIGVGPGNEDDVSGAGVSITDDGDDGAEGNGEAARGDDTEGARFVRFEPSVEQLTAIREALETGEVAGLSKDNFAIGKTPKSLDDSAGARDILIIEGGIDGDGRNVPPSLLFNPNVLQKQASLRTASEDAFPYDAEVRELLQRQFDQVWNDDLNALDGHSAVDDITQIFDGLNLPAIGNGIARASGANAGNDDWIVTEDSNTADGAGLRHGDDLAMSVGNPNDKRGARNDDDEILLTDSLA